MASLRSTVLLTYFFSGSISLDGAFPIIWFSSDLTTMDHAIVYALLFYWEQGRKVLTSVTFSFNNIRKYSDNLGTCHTLFEKSKTEGKVSEDAHRRQNGESALRPSVIRFSLKLRQTNVWLIVFGC